MPKAKVTATKSNPTPNREAIKALVREVLQSGEVEFDLDLAEDPVVTRLQARLKALEAQFAAKPAGPQRVDAVAATIPKPPAAVAPAKSRNN